MPPEACQNSSPPGPGWVSVQLAVVYIDGTNPVIDQPSH